MFTAAVESECGKMLPNSKNYRDMGMFQISRVAEREVFRWTKENQPSLYRKLMRMRKDHRSLSNHLEYQIIMARAYYYRWVDGCGTELPSSAKSISHIWKKFYNTPSGRGSAAWAEKKAHNLLNERKLNEGY